MNRLAALIATSLLLATPTSRADTLNLATGNDYAPFTDQKLMEGGMATEIVKRAYAESHTDIKLAWVSWDAAKDDTKSGKYAGTFPWVRTADREAVFLFSDPIFVLNQKVFMRADKAFSAAGQANFKGKVYCHAKGWAVLPFVDALIKSNTISQVEAADITPCAKLVGEGKADFYVTDEIQGQQAFQAAGLTDKQIVQSKESVADQTLHVIVSKTLANGREVIDLFNKGLKSLKASGEYGKIVKKHIAAALKR